MKSPGYHEHSKLSGLELGSLPFLSFFCSIALLIISFANTAARNGNTYAEFLFITGLVILFVPTAYRILSAAPSRAERIALLTMLGVAFYLVKVLNSPLYFTYPDELQHLRTTLDVLNTHFLFQENPYLPVSPLYPGLENIVSAFVNLSGLDIFTSGLIIIGLARILFIQSIYLLYEEISGDERLAGIAAIIYMTNLHFLYFDAQFSYESIALPLAITVIYISIRRLRKQSINHMGFTVALLLCLLAVATTHHVTTFFLVGFLFLWLVVSYLFSFLKIDNLSPNTLPLLSMVIGFTWIVYVASFTINYLTPNLISALTQFMKLVYLESLPRTLFVDYLGQVPPIWDRFFMYTSVLIVLGSLPFGIFFTWRNFKNNSFIAILIILAMLYPVSQILRFVERGVELAGRITPFIYVGLSFVLANVILELFRTENKRKHVYAAPGLAILLLGGMIMGFPRWGRLPGPYLVGADMRSIDAQSVSASNWARDHLGKNNRIIADRANGFLLMSYGEQFQITSFYYPVNVLTVYFSEQIGSTQLEQLIEGQIEYVFVDHRLSTALPLNGYYFEYGEENKSPIERKVLEKFDHIKFVDRVFDSGDLFFYDVRDISNAPKD